MLYNEEDHTISTERLVLRFFEQSDAEEVARLCNNYNIYINTLYLPYPYTINDAEKWIERHRKNFNAGRAYEFAITDKFSGNLYGAIALSYNQAFNNGEIAYWIGEEYWGNGYATEAAKAVVKFAFEVKGYHKVYARFFNTNPASGKVLQKIGMKEEGRFIDHVIKEGQYLDMIHYGIINPLDKNI